MTAISRKKKGSPIRHSTVDKIVLTVNAILLTLFLIIIAYPLLYVIFASFSGGISTLSLNILPKTISLIGYQTVLEYTYFWTGYANSLLYVVLGTVVSLVVTICCAYPLSRSDFMAGPLMMVLCLITMYFSGGLIPTYVTIRNLGLIDTIWAVVLPGALSVYNMIVMRTFFRNSIPNELREAAALDGCGDLRYLLSIVLPLSGSIIAVICLYVAVGLWNGYFGPLIYLNSRSKMPLSIVLREILVLSSQDITTINDPELLENMAKRQQVMKYAVIVVASIPVMMIYPFVQKYFVKGVMIGSVKG